MKSLSSGKTRGSHPHHRRKNKNKKYEKFPKHLDKQRKTVSEQSQNELGPIEDGIPYPIPEDENK